VSKIQAFANILMAPAVLLHELTHYAVARPWLKDCDAHVGIRERPRLELTFAEGTPVRGAQAALIAPLAVGLLVAPFVYPYVSLSPLGVYTAGLWSVYTVTGATDLMSVVKLERQARQPTDAA